MACMYNFEVGMDSRSCLQKVPKEESVGSTDAQQDVVEERGPKAWCSRVESVVLVVMMRMRLSSKPGRTI